MQIASGRFGGDQQGGRSGGVGAFSAAKERFSMV